MSSIDIADHEFAQFQRFIFEAAGITLSDAKKPLVCGRLAKRLAHFRLDSFSAYFRLLTDGSAPDECQTAIDLLTTNETYFFREPKHFELVRAQALAARGRREPFRVWSAACSSGEEVYSLAMVLEDTLEHSPWEVLGTDISSRVLERARGGHYRTERTDHIPRDYLQRFCLKGQGSEAGTLLIERALRQKVLFAQLNLNTALPAVGMFDIIFLRNVMIYFSADTKRDVAARILHQLKPGGHLCIGHSETLNDISSAVRAIAPAIYVKG